MQRRLLLSLVGLVALGAVCSAVAHADDMKKEKKTAIATFAGGCFWCMEPPFDDVKGVKSTTSGFTGGKEKNPTYEDVWRHKTGHCEAIEIEYDPNVVSYEKLLDVYWHNIDPTSGDGQFCDRGASYRPEIFYHDEEQKRLAEESRKKVELKFGAVPVKITRAGDFWPAEEYHQDFYMKNPDRYHEYRTGCGRDRRLEELWGEQAGH